VDYSAAVDIANTSWWENFQDPVLTELIVRALNQNLDLRIAAARVEEAAALVQNAKSELYPQLGYGAGASQRRESEARTYPFGTIVERDHSLFGIGLNASWELDIWGRIRRSTEAARAELLSTEEARQAVILSLVAGVVNGYLELLRLDKELVISNKTLADRKEWLQLFERKKRGGQISEVELAQVKSSYQYIASRIPMLEMQIALQENMLSVLLGRHPGPIKRDRTLDTLAVLEVPEGIPSSLLGRRPDIRQSEQHLIAANANIGVARTLYFPSISLTGLFGYASDDLGDLLSSTANLYSIGGGLLGPIFSGGRIKSENLRAEAAYKRLLNEYLSTILNAFQEVNDALVSIQRLREQLQRLGQLVGTLNDYNNYSRDSFNSGYTSYLTVLDAQSKLFEAEVRQARAQSALFTATVNTYKSMGGGWVTEAAGMIDSHAEGRQPEAKPEKETKNKKS
jgi:multidrug efflux system outer membrane protein